MGYQIYEVGERWGGYGVPTVCEHPKCNKEIDRGVSYACGGEPFSEHGCDRYFCGEHLNWHCFNSGGRRECVNVCERCDKRKSPFPYKEETREWIEHLLKHESWEEWRTKNQEEVAELKLKLSKINK